MADNGNLRKNFRKTLKSARLAANLTEEEAARILGKTSSYVSECESGEHCVDLLELMSLCKAYSVDLQTFIKTMQEGKRIRPRRTSNTKSDWKR